MSMNGREVSHTVGDPQGRLLTFLQANEWSGQRAIHHHSRRLSPVHAKYPFADRQVDQLAGQRGRIGRGGCQARDRFQRVSGSQQSQRRGTF